MAAKKAIGLGKIHPFYGKYVCITGTLEYMTRDDAVSEIKKAGGYFDKTVSGKTDYLVVADKPGAIKLKKAKQLYTTQLTEAQFTDMLRQIERPTLELPAGVKPNNPDVDKLGFESRDW